MSEIEDMMKANEQLVEWLSGLRNGLIRQGFSEHAAETIVLIMLSGTQKQ